MPVGPSLRQLHAHKQIHDTGLGLAVNMTDELIRTYQNGTEDEVIQEVIALVDFWESRVISHADAEEEADGFYTEVENNNPELHDKVQQLTRDHDIMRQVVAKIKTQMENEGFSTQIIDYFRSLIIVNEIHSRDEEAFLLKD
ncbi:hypothetical protein BHU61_08525 [Macrococcus epidermidis]|uniref:Hemerythrin-like domain-containing protein n=1 Tax=Macrococcus epidermidis TaxID=1902580 RepID=A0A327ZRG3_9STAP|nr:hypothetical protein [Macrococcus epidermidis]RAK44747.1 hypothetical protein BHU61_08525 [Macrococcus epidermidis]